MAALQTEMAFDKKMTDVQLSAHSTSWFLRLIGVSFAVRILYNQYLTCVKYSTDVYITQCPWAVSIRLNLILFFILFNLTNICIPDPRS